jgi:hypothetical protein
MKRLITICLSLLFIAQSAMASQRLDDLLNSDLAERFESISSRKEDIEKSKEMMNSLQAKLKEARKGKAAYIKFRNVAGTVAIIAIAVGAYKITFPTGLKFTGMKLMLSSYIAVSGLNEGMIKLNQSDIEDLSREVILSLIRISKLEKALNAELKTYCHQDPRDRLCYELKN